MNNAKEQLVWLGGNPGDGWYEMSEGMVELINRACDDCDVKLIAGSGSTNVSKVDAN